MFQKFKKTFSKYQGKHQIIVKIRYKIKDAFRKFKKKLPPKKLMLKFVENSVRLIGVFMALGLLFAGFLHLPLILPGTSYEGIITGLGRSYDTKGIITTRHARASVSYPADRPQGIAGVDLSWNAMDKAPAIGDPVDITVLIDGRVMSSTGLKDMAHPATFFIPGTVLLLISLIRVTDSDKKYKKNYKKYRRGRS